MSRRFHILRKVFSRVERQHGPLPSKCWVYQGCTSGAGRGGGYGRITIDGGTMAVHRVIFQVMYGPIPPKKQIDHKCKNRLCCNPRHLEMVTHRQNQRRKKQ